MNSRKTIAAAALLLAVTAGALAWIGRTADDDGALVLYGNVDVREVELAFRQAGRLATMHVDEGHAVAAGDMVAELDDQPYRDALAVAEAQWRGAQAELEKLERGSRPQEIRQAEEAVRRAEAVFARAEEDLVRQDSLARSGASSQKILEAARATRAEAAATLAAARESLSLQREGPRSEDIAAAHARVAAAEANLAQARTALADTRLVAPANATVLARVREPGSMVTSRDPVYTLSLRDPVYVRAYVSEPELGRIAPGMPVSITTDSSERAYRGHIGFIAPRAEFTPRAVETTELRTDLVYRLRIVVDAGDEGLRQGMPVTVSVAAKRSGAD